MPDAYILPIRAPVDIICPWAIGLRNLKIISNIAILLSNSALAGFVEVNHREKPATVLTSLATLINSLARSPYGDF